MGFVLAFVVGLVTATGTIVILYYRKASELRHRESQLRFELNHLVSGRSTLQEYQGRLEQERQSLLQYRQSLDGEQFAFASRVVQYDAIVTENNVLKQDLFNLSIRIRKFAEDHRVLELNQGVQNQKSNELASRYLKESVSWISGMLTTNNFASSKAKLLKAIENCRNIGFDITVSEADELVQDFQNAFESEVRKEYQAQEQARIKARIREEERLEREMQRHIDDAQREQAAIEAALAKALREVQDEHSAEIELLRARLREAQENTARAVSQAQLTKAGHVYVISNLGAFGRDVFKVGMTRRLEPDERIRELSSASVPFPFDVHMMISCDNAPALESALHRELHRNRINKVNFRKEFFRTDIETIRGIVERNHGQVEYVASPGAFQYNESLGIADEDFEFINRTVESLAVDDEELE